MKSIRIYLIMLLIFCFASSNAQLFTGGSLSLDITSSDTPANNSSNYDVSMMPLVGKFLSEKLAAGLSLNFSLEGNKNENTNTLSKSSEFGVSPFLRYYAFKWNKFSIYGQGNIGINFSGSKTENNGIITKDPNTTRISLDIYPGFSYDITDRLSLQTSLYIFRMDYTLSIKDNQSKDKHSSFGLSGGLGNIIAVGYVVIGGIYKF